MLIQYYTCLSTVMLNYLICTFSWSAHIIQLKNQSCPLRHKPPTSDLHTAKLPDMSTEIQGHVSHNSRDASAFCQSLWLRMRAMGMLRQHPWENRRNQKRIRQKREN